MPPDVVAYLPKNEAIIPLGEHEVEPSSCECGGNSRLSSLPGTRNVACSRKISQAPHGENAGPSLRKKPCVTHCYARLYESGRQDLNLRPSDPQSDALARLRHAPFLPKSAACGKTVLSQIRRHAASGACEKTDRWTRNPAIIACIRLPGFGNRGPPVRCTVPVC